MRIGMVGLGRMGANMVLRLIKAGHEVVVWDRSEAVVKDLASKGAIAAADQAALNDMATGGWSSDGATQDGVGVGDSANSRASRDAADANAASSSDSD